MDLATVAAISALGALGWATVRKNMNLDRKDNDGYSERADDHTVPTFKKLNTHAGPQALVTKGSWIDRHVAARNFKDGDPRGFKHGRKHQKRHIRRHGDRSTTKGTYSRAVFRGQMPYTPSEYRLRHPNAHGKMRVKHRRPYQMDEELSAKKKRHRRLMPEDNGPRLLGMFGL